MDDLLIVFKAYTMYRPRPCKEQASPRMGIAVGDRFCWGCRNENVGYADGELFEIQ